jgi:hypothetical protein
MKKLIFVLAAILLLASCNDSREQKIAESRTHPIVEGNTIYVGGSSYRVYDFEYKGVKYRLFNAGYYSSFSVVEVK